MSPLTTYGGKACTKDSVLQSVHTIAYAGERPPEKLVGEVAMDKDPIRFDIGGKQDLPSELRINMGVEYPIYFNTRVSHKGDVHPEFKPKLLDYRNEIRTRAKKRNATELGPLGPKIYNPLTNTYHQ